MPKEEQSIAVQSHLNNRVKENKLMLQINEKD